MRVYNGPAVIIPEDETEVTVTANLRRYLTGLRTDWGGTLTPSTEGSRQLTTLTKGVAWLA